MLLSDRIQLRIWCTLEVLYPHDETLKRFELRGAVMHEKKSFDQDLQGHKMESKYVWNIAVDDELDEVTTDLLFSIEEKRDILWRIQVGKDKQSWAILHTERFETPSRLLLLLFDFSRLPGA